MARSFIKRRRNDVVFACIFLMYHAAYFLPRKIGLFLFGLLGRLIFLIPTKDKKRTLAHLTKIYSGTWSPKQIRRTAARVYYNIGKNVFDALYLSRCSNEEFDALVKNAGFSGMQEGYEQGRGIVAITSHSGCYEMNVQLLARKGLRCLTIGQELFDKRVDKLIVTMRKRNNITYLYRDQSSREVIRFLNKGGALGVLLDQDTYGDGVFADFLGIPAYTPSGPVRMAMRYNLPVFAGYSARQKDDTHCIYISERIQLDNTGNYERDLVNNVQKVNDFLCSGIRQYPDQWVWMHRRWKRKPDDERYKNVPNIQSC